MALHIDKDGRIEVITPPKTLTDKEKQILENAPINKELIQKARTTNFNIVYG